MEQVNPTKVRETRMIIGDSYAPWRSTHCKPYYTKSAARLTVAQQPSYPLQKGLSIVFQWSECAEFRYQRGQFWIRRFQKQAAALCTALANLTVVISAADFLTRALHMLEAIGWTAAHRFLFAELRMHLLGWPRFLIPHGCHVSFPAA